VRVREGAVAKEGQSTELVALLRTTSFSRFLALGFGLASASAQKTFVRQLRARARVTTTLMPTGAPARSRPGIAAQERTKKSYKSTSRSTHSRSFIRIVLRLSNFV